MIALIESKVLDILDRKAKAPAGYQHIPMWIIFNIKVDLRRKTCLEAGGHVTKHLHGIVTAVLLPDKVYDWPFWLLALTALTSLWLM